MDSRMKELIAKGVDSRFEEVLRDIQYRDRQDSERAAAPLRPAEDAVYVDTTEIGFDESFLVLRQIISEKLGLTPVEAVK